MATADLTDYYQEVYNFLSSMSIKFSPLADAMNNIVIQKGYSVDLNTPASWKYYLNLTGQYHPTDTVMTVVSLDTQQSMVFSPTTLAQSPKTSAAYVPGQTLYQNLCLLYPNQVDLIKSIVYPASDINSIINADDFTILSYSTDFLEASEYDIVMQNITQFLGYISTRWYFPFYSYEPYYTWIFWGNLWQQLIGVVLLARILAILTPSVHTWHVWQYLTSYGLADYRDILSRTQTMFLYRNLPYLIANRGKQTNLVTLADNLLSSLGVGLYGRDIWQQTQDGFATCQLTADLVAVGVPTKYFDALPAETAESVADMQQRLYVLGTEPDISASATAAIALKLATTTLNTMPTKLLELRQISTDQKFSLLFNHFLLDSLVYAIQNDIYVASVEITEASTATTLTLSTKEALILYGYAAAQALLQTPVGLPTQYHISAAFTRNPTIPTTMEFAGYTYPMTDFTNVANYLSTYMWPTISLTTAADFTAAISIQFAAMINQVQVSRMTEDRIASRALHKLTQSVVLNETISLNLASQTTYAAWLAIQSVAMQTMLNSMDAASSTPELYATLADLILSNLLPATPTFVRYGNFAITDTTYAKFKQLFIQLCSYNVLFLDSDATVETGFFIGKLASYTASRTIDWTFEFPLDSPLQLVHHMTNTTTIPDYDITLRSDPHLQKKNAISGGILATCDPQIGGYHRIRVGSAFRIASVTYSLGGGVNLQANDSVYLTNTPA